MGCYGIGVTRTLQAVIEQSHDANGIIWPISVSPYDIEVMAINVQHAESVKIAEQLITELEAAGLSVLYDDRDERPGVKFKDADLVGIPIRISVGEKSLAKGGVELKLRREAAPRIVPAAEAVQAARDLVAELWREVAV
jgi:prolyl-tRNA synthetase